MTNQFFLKPLPSITFGAGSIAKLPQIAASFGKRCLVVTGSGFKRRTHQWPAVERELRAAGLELAYTIIDSEPTPEMIDAIVDEYFDRKPEAVIAVGGGSVVDGGKAVSAMLPAGGRVVDYLEGVGTRKPSGIKVPFIAVPTTAGTGSEATANAVITKPGTGGFKKSLRHNRYIPDQAVVDPDLMRTCPPQLTASCAMDTFTQLVEGYLSTAGTEISDTIAWEGLKNLQNSLLKVFYNGDDIDARADMAFATLCSGIVLANAGLGVIHGLAPSLGSLFCVPHGVVCGTLMASGNQITLAELTSNRQIEPSVRNRYLKKYARLERLFSGQEPDSERPGAKFIDYLNDITVKLNLPRLGSFGVTGADLDRIAAAASNKNNPIRLDGHAIKQIVALRI